MSNEGKANLRLEIAHVLFMDVVGYSKLLVDEQTEALQLLNQIVRGTGEFRAAEEKGELIRLPTGDGMALVFLSNPEDPVQCALEISKAIKAHPELRLRMGIHSGPVKKVSDVNDRANVTGAGINLAQRVMDCGDAGHILLSKRAADDLAQYRHWQPCLHDVGELEVKHGTLVHIFNLYTEEAGNPQLPHKLPGQKPRRPTGAVGTRSYSPTWRKPALIAGSLVLVIGVTVGLWSVTEKGGPKSAVSAAAPSPSEVPPASPSAAISEKSIAVLPFLDLSQAKDQEYFCEGISEEILDVLAKVEGLRVVARTSSFSFKGKAVAVAEIAQKLGVQNVLEGSLRREGNRIRVTAQLISARDGFHLWSETYERELQGVFAMQDEITHAITDALKLKLIGQHPAAEKTQNAEAHDLYLQGVFYSNKSTEAGLRKSLDFFQRSLEKDPNSARSWTGIAKDWNWLADAYVKPLEAYPAMKAAALRAVELDEGEAEAHAYISEAKRILDWDLPGAEAELRRALVLDPNSGTAHLYLALTVGIQGRRDESLVELRAAVKADPISPVVNNMAAVGSLANGDLEEATVLVKRGMEIDQNYIYIPVLGYVYLQKGMLPEAIEAFQKAQQTMGTPQPGLAIAYARSGRLTEAREILANLEHIANTQYYSGEDIASVYVALGDHNAAFTWLERARAEHSGPLHAVAIRSAFAPLHSDPRFPAFLKSIGLQPAELPVAPLKSN